MLNICGVVDHIAKISSHFSRFHPFFNKLPISIGNIIIITALVIKNIKRKYLTCTESPWNNEWKSGMQFSFLLEWGFLFYSLALFVTARWVKEPVQINQHICIISFFYKRKCETQHWYTITENSLWKCMYNSDKTQIES